MRWKNVKLIFSREVRDQLRDRRTLFMIAVLPLLLYPSLGIGMVQMMVLFSEQPRTVVVLGTEHLPTRNELQLIDGDRFIRRWFAVRQDVDKLNVITDRPATSGESPASEKKAELLRDARAIEEMIEKHHDQTTSAADADAAGDVDTDDSTDGDPESDSAPAAAQLRSEPEATQSATDVASTNRELSERFAASGMQVLIIIPEGFAENIERINQQIAERQLEEITAADIPRPIVLHNSADEKSLIAYRRVEDALSKWEKRILKDRLSRARLPASLTTPVNVNSINLAQDDELSATIWSKLFPALLVIMAVTGAFYPSIDLGAGEKERGTMETLLICPASRTEIVMGKFFTVMLFSMSTAVLNLLSMGFTGKYMTALAGSGSMSNVDSLQPPGAAAMLWIAVMLVPLAALFSALCLSLATFARSSKEGQYYLTPLLMVTMGLTVFCLSPAIEITPFYSVMPVVGVALLLKEVLANSGSMESLWYAIPVLLTSIGYSLLALWWAIEQFSREDVLFREAERFELGLWVRHLLRDKEPTPSFIEAIFCFVLIMLLQFGAMRFMQDAIASATDQTRMLVMMQLLMVQQIAIIASPALFMGTILTTSVVKTFRLRWPSWKMLGAAVVLPFLLHPISVELSGVLQRHFFPPLSESFLEQISAMADPNQPLWLVLLTFAVAPAICEEVAFRGFMLSGFSRNGRIGLAIIISSLAFGLMHMIPQQVFNAALLGLVLGLIAVRSGSLLPGIVFHFLWNSTAVLHGRVGHGWLTDASDGWFFRADGHAVGYQPATLLIAGGIAAVIIRWLIRHPGPADDASATTTAPADSADVPESPPELRQQPPVSV